MGAVHSKRRSRLKTERVRKAVLIKDSINHQYPQICTRRRQGLSSTATNSNPNLDDSDSDDELEQAPDRAPADHVPPDVPFSAIIDNLASTEFASNESCVPHGDGLLLRNVFDYSSLGFAEISDQLWASGQQALKTELALLDERAINDELARLRAEAPSMSLNSLITPAHSPIALKPFPTAPPIFLLPVLPP